jgi:hypothetical protein
MPGPAVWSGGAASGSGTSPVATTPAKEEAPATKPTTMSTVRVPAATPAPGKACAALFGQCGGDGFSGSKCCSAGACKAMNQWYSQCLN